MLVSFKIFEEKQIDKSPETTSIVQADWVESTHEMKTN